jgi:hypothetical protein
LTTPRHGGHNDQVRRLLLACLFCLTAWAALALMAAPSVDASDAGAAVASCTDARSPQGAGNSDGRWDRAHGACVSASESRWNSAAGHADLATGRSGIVLSETRSATPGNRLDPQRPAHLRHVPLLI